MELRRLRESELDAQGVAQFPTFPHSYRGRGVLEGRLLIVPVSIIVRELNLDETPISPNYGKQHSLHSQFPIFPFMGLRSAGLRSPITGNVPNTLRLHALEGPGNMGRQECA